MPLPPEPPASEPALRRPRLKTLSLLWITYAAHYLCRVNLAASQSSLSADLGLSKRQLGGIISWLKILYGTGQLVNGPLADRLSPRLLATGGLAASALLNLLVAHVTGHRGLLIAWTLNGYVQAFGWTSVVRIAANWFPPRLRDAASGVLGTSYILGSGLSWLLAGWLTQTLGWRYAFWVPAWVCLGVAGVVFVLLKDKPSAGGPDSHAGGACGGSEYRFATSSERQQQSRIGVRSHRPPPALLSPSLLALCLANACLLFGYHGLLDWTPHFLAEGGHLTPGAAATQAFMMPLGGTLGCLALVFLARGSRAPGLRWGVVAPLVALAACTFTFPRIVARTPDLAPGGLLLLGALSSPPASVMACAMPANLAGSDCAGAAAGIVDASGYAGSALSGYLSGRVLDTPSSTRSREAAWDAVWRMWPLGMLAAALLIFLVAGQRGGGPAQGEPTNAKDRNPL